MATASFRENIIALWDWRRRITELYAQVRALEPRAASQHWRAVRDDLFRSHPQSPIGPSRRSSFSGLSYFEYDPSLRILISLVSTDASEATKMDLGPDGPLSLTPFARTNGLRQKFGGELTMYWIGGYGGGVFLPFKDGTTGAETYGGGRYLLDTIKGADLGCTSDGRAILDFNFAYYPSCAYSDLWICPLAPAENVLPAAIRGGEQQAV